MNQFWKNQIKVGTPLPSQLYSSPFIRAVRTCQITFGDILIENGKQKPMVLEDLREVMGLYPYDKRGRMSRLRAEFPNFDFEEGLEEEDTLWKPDYRETREEHATREGRAFDIIFNSQHKDHAYVSITVHNGTIGAILLLLRRTRFIIPTGGAFAFVIKAVKISA
ncbi:hypothetical protein FRC02_005875 [Tulasnella sp. 418]|nr:hypothetical protein FRC02_005875 [Tulasnella sp. 418]